MSTSGQDGYAWRALKNARSFQLAAIGGTSGVNLGTGAGAMYVQQQRVTAGYFHVLGVPLARGREFNENEGRAGGPPVVVLSYGIWQRLFNGDASIVGRTVLLRGEPYMVTGITGAAFRPREPVDLWTPLMPSTKGEGQGLKLRRSLPGCVPVPVGPKPAPRQRRSERRLLRLGRFLPRSRRI